MEKTFVMLGAGLMFLAVAAGAFGSHALGPYFDKNPDLGAIYDTAVRYHMIHALALLGVAWASTRWPGGLVNGSGWLLFAGILIFSGLPLRTQPYRNPLAGRHHPHRRRGLPLRLALPPPGRLARLEHVGERRVCACFRPHPLTPLNTL